MSCVRKSKGPCLEMATKVVNVDGTKYRVPEWVTHLTRERGSPYVIGWDLEPILDAGIWSLQHEGGRWTYAVLAESTTCFIHKVAV